MPVTMSPMHTKALKRMTQVILTLYNGRLTATRFCTYHAPRLPSRSR